MKRPYDPENDSPEARANWEIRHIYNIYRRKFERDKLLEKYKAEKVVAMFPDEAREKTLTSKED